MTEAKNFKKIVLHIVTTLELGGAQQNTLYTVKNMKNFRGVLICGEEGILSTEGVETFRVKTLVRKISPFKDFLAFLKILSILKKIKPVICHTHSSKAGIIGRVAAYFASVPVRVHTFHGFGFNDWQSPFVKNFFIFCEKLVSHITTHFFAVSAPNIEKAVSLGIAPREKISLLHSGIDTSRFNAAPSRERARRMLGIGENFYVVGMVSCFKKQKDPLTFVDAAFLLKKRIPNTKFVLVGDGILRPQIEKAIYEKGLSDDFILTGWRKDVENILPAFDVNVLTSLWEGLPRVLLEASFLGIPSVASAIDGNTEFIESGVNGFLVPVKKPSEFAEKIEFLLKNPDEARVFAHRARKKISGDYEIKGMLEKLEQEYSQFLL